MLAEPDLDLSRVHFTGLLGRRDDLRLMHARDVFVYFAVPSVLSSSLIEAMSAGCTLIASDVAPMRESLTDGVNGLFVNHDDTAQIVAATCKALDTRNLALLLGDRERRDAIRRYVVRWIWPTRAALLETLVRDKASI